MSESGGTGMSAGAGGGMTRSEWLSMVLREANRIAEDFGNSLGGAPPIEAELAASESAARVIAATEDPLGYVRHSAVSEPKEQLWRKARSWGDAVIAVACSCLARDILETARRITTGELPGLDPGQIQ